MVTKKNNHKALIIKYLRNCRNNVRLLHFNNLTVRKQTALGTKNMKTLLSITFSICMCILSSNAGASKLYSVNQKGENGSYQFIEGIVDDWIAKVNFSDNTFKDGWGYLNLETNPNYADEIQAFAAGYAEGSSTTEMIYNSWRNTVEGMCDWMGKEFCVRLRDYLSKNDKWMAEMIEKEKFNCPIWHNIELILGQLQGVCYGYNQVTKFEKISCEDFLFMNLLGDIEDLQSALKPDKERLSFDEWISSINKVKGNGHCSALIKVLPGNTDLYVSHVTWNTYQSMLRMQKKYTFSYHVTANQSSGMAPGNAVSFSSYPGILHSGDDFYILSSGLVTLETTIGNSNPALWSEVKPVGEILEWLRVLVANRISNSGSEWSKYFKMHNSGTYNNQWMVVDYKLFNFGASIKPNTLWVLEQIPGYIHAEDLSSILRKDTYWPSYNVPYYKDVFNMSGVPALVERYGDWFSYDKTPRALIFKRDHNKVKDLGSMLKLMRYNDFKNDPLSKCNCTPPYSAENAISARNDLNPKNGTYPFGALGHRSHGGTDAKITSSGLANKFLFLAINGPTYDQQPVFEWSKQDFASDTPHYGHPDKWQFPVTKYTWQ